MDHVQEKLEDVLRSIDVSIPRGPTTMGPLGGRQSLIALAMEYLVNFLDAIRCLILHVDQLLVAATTHLGCVPLMDHQYCPLFK